MDSDTDTAVDVDAFADAVMDEDVDVDANVWQTSRTLRANANSRLLLLGWHIYKLQVHSDLIAHL